MKQIGVEQDEELGYEEIEENGDNSVDAILKRKTVLNAADIIINPFTYSPYHQENSVLIDQINVTGIPDE